METDAVKNKAKKPANKNKSMYGTSKQQPNIGGANRLRVDLIEARNVPNQDLLSKSDPYVVMLVSGVKQTSVVKKNDSNPRFNQTFSFDVRNPNSDCLMFELWDKDRFTKDDKIGGGMIQLNSLQRNVPKDYWISLTNKPKTQLHFVLTAETFGHGGSNYQQPMQQQQQQYTPNQSYGSYPNQPYQQPPQYGKSQQPAPQPYINTAPMHQMPMQHQMPQYGANQSLSPQPQQYSAPMQHQMSPQPYNAPSIQNQPYGTPSQQPYVPNQSLSPQPYTSPMNPQYISPQHSPQPYSSPQAYNVPQQMGYSPAPGTNPEYNQQQNQPLYPSYPPTY
jgi:hypothetical protein